MSAVSPPRGPRRPFRLAALLALGAGPAGGCTGHHVLGEINGAPPAASGPPCGAFVPGDNVFLCAATYLAGRGNEPPAAVALGRDGTVLVAGAFEGVEFPGATTVTFPGGAAGGIVRLKPDGRQVISVTRLGDVIVDVDVDPATGNLAVAGAPFGAALLAPDATRVIWQKPATQPLRVAAGKDGTVAVLEGDRANVSVFRPDGTPAGRFGLQLDMVVGADLAVHGASQTIVVTGRVPAGTATQPFLFGYRYTGEIKWRSYAWRETDIRPRSLGASTRGIRVAIGGDDLLYYLGESHGGNTVHGKDPRDLDRSAENRTQDAYDTPYATRLYILYWARFRPEDGRFEGGEYLLTRGRGVQGENGESVNPEAIAADEKGNVLVAGKLACCIQNSDKKKIRDMPVTPAEPDAFVMLSSADRRSRLLWTTFGGPGIATGVAIGQGTAAVVAFQEKAYSDRARLITVDAIQPAPPGGEADTYLAVFPVP